MESAARIADVEVKTLLEERRIKIESDEDNDPNKLLKFKNRTYIIDKTAEYMEVSTLPDGATSEMVSACFQRIREKGLDLSEAELISIVNHVPVNEAEILTLIPSIERYQDGLEDLKHIIQQCFGCSETSERDE